MITRLLLLAFRNKFSFHLESSSKSVPNVSTSIVLRCSLLKLIEFCHQMGSFFSSSSYKRDLQRTPPLVIRDSVMKSTNILSCRLVFSWSTKHCCLFAVLFLCVRPTVNTLSTWLWLANRLTSLARGFLLST